MRVGSGVAGIRSAPVGPGDDPGGVASGVVTLLRRRLDDALEEIEVELTARRSSACLEGAADGAAGTTKSYAQLARRVGAPAAVRAVGAANGANPVAVVVPCHRIIGSSGSLTGYGGGLDRKRWLLHHEGVKRTLF